MRTILLSVLFLFNLQTKPDSDFTLSKSHVGNIRLGMSINSLYQLYNRECFRLVDLQLEGQFSPAIELSLGNDSSSVVTIEYTCRKSYWIIDRISLYDKRFSTAEGIRVGSTLGELRRNYKIDWIDFGETALFARVDELGMSFALDISELGDGVYDLVKKNKLPDNIRIAFILLTQ